MQCLTNLRIEEAKRLLKDPEQKIADIAVKCGFSNSKYIDKIFKKQSGYTPTEFRLKNRNKKSAAALFIECLPYFQSGLERMRIRGGIPHDDAVADRVHSPLAFASS